MGGLARVGGGAGGVGSGPAESWAAVRQRLPEAVRVRGEIRRIEKRDIGAVNAEQERLRLALRKLELRGVTSGPEVAALTAQLAPLQARYQAQADRLAAPPESQTPSAGVPARGGETKR